MHTFIYIYIHTYVYPVFRTRSYTYARGHPRVRVPTRLCTHAHARASAAPPLTTAHAASTTRRARPAAVARRRAGQHASTTILAPAAACRRTRILAGHSQRAGNATAATCTRRFLQVSVKPVLSIYPQATLAVYLQLKKFQVQY